MVPFNWDIQLTVYLFVIPLRCFVANYNKILSLVQSIGQKGEDGGISKSLGVVKKDKLLLASDMQTTNSKANSFRIEKKELFPIPKTIVAKH